MSTRKNDWGETPLSQVQAQNKYDRSHTTDFYMKLNLRTDQDIIIWLRKQRNRQGAIKQLIRQQLKNKP